MRALAILQNKLAAPLDFMHAKQRAAFWRAVAGLLRGNKLWLTALGRSLPGTCADKHRIKAIDRLLGSAAIQSAVLMMYSALVSFLLRNIHRPIVLVDWTDVDAGFGVLSAKVCFRGRALSILSRAFPKSRKCSPKAEREFLDDLMTVVPRSCKPIFVTDAGCLFRWFDELRARGWDYVGRVRGRLSVNLGRRWLSLPKVHALATGKPRDLGELGVGKNNTREHRIVLSAKPKLKGRRKIGRNGRPRRSTADRQRAAAAREPWVLVTSLADAARVVVGVYGTRMQIEETFRDIKSHRYGWSVEDARTKDPRRIDVLLLIGAFAAVATHVVGLAAENTKLQHGFQANTERDRRVFSTFFLGTLIIARELERVLSLAALRRSMARLRDLLSAASLDQSRPRVA